jgi:hypothetical protein
MLLANDLDAAREAAHQITADYDVAEFSKAAEVLILGEMQASNPPGVSLSRSVVVPSVLPVGPSLPEFV